jgi:hypothetical protein
MQKTGWDRSLTVAPLAKSSQIRVRYSVAAANATGLSIFSANDLELLPERGDSLRASFFAHRAELKPPPAALVDQFHETL